MPVSPLLRARRSPARGQSLVLAVLLMLVVVMTTFLTFAIGARTRRKIQLQAVADATAYSMAVAEARAFNYYAWMNRALVAHHVSILAVHSHQSFLTFYEDMLGATGNNWDLIARQLQRRCARGSLESCEGRVRAEKIRDIYLESYFDPQKNLPMICYWVGGQRDCRVDLECTGGHTCDDVDVHKRRGAIFFHKEWHAKDSSNSCARLVEGSRDHFQKVQYLRSRQLRVESQLKVMMTGRQVDGRQSEEDAAALPRNTAPGMYASFDGVSQGVRGSLPDLLAKLTDDNLRAEPSGGDVSVRYYQRAVDNGMRLRVHRDYDEVLAATRFPAFITRRGWELGGSSPLEEEKDPNLRRLERAARRAARGNGTPITIVTNEGTSRMVKVGSRDEDPGSRNWHNPAVNEGWPLNYSNPARPWGGLAQARAAHEGRHNDAYGPGEGDGLVAEDHGQVESRYVLDSGAVIRATTRILQGRNGVWADPHDHDKSGGQMEHSNHVFHGDLMWQTGHGIGDCDGPDCESADYRRGFYRGHMRFKLRHDASELWNMPRTLTLITRPAAEARRMPWDFDFQAELPGPVRFTTVSSNGDVAADGRMAAFAGGLVYFHKPRVRRAGEVDEEYREPPNLWNPFWRAKLHPVKEDDARQATAGGHAPSSRALGAMSEYGVVNY